MAMTTDTRRAAWDNTYNEYLKLNQRLEQAQPHERRALERALADAQDDLLDTPAPTLEAVRAKLYALFDGELHGLDQASEERRLLIEDLETLIQAQRDLLGA